MSSDTPFIFLFSQPDYLLPSLLYLVDPLFLNLHIFYNLQSNVISIKKTSALQLWDPGNAINVEVGDAWDVLHHQRQALIHNGAMGKVQAPKHRASWGS